MTKTAKPEITTAESALTGEELAMVLDCIGDTPTGRRNLALVLLMGDAGLRVSEALDLEPRDVVRKAGQITHVIIRNGKGSKTARQPLTSRAAVALAEWLEEREELGLGDGAVFCTISSGEATGHAAEGQQLEPGKRLNRHYVGQFVKRLGQKAGLGDRLHPHLLRHTAITNYLRANRDLELTRKFARHSNIRTTADIYAHLVQEDVDNGTARMEKALQPEPQGDGADVVKDLAAALATLTPEQRAALRAALD